ncbi:hypothetical protein OSTOST_03019 [Ostertagia ostertagi]
MSLPPERSFRSPHAILILYCVSARLHEDDCGRRINADGGNSWARCRVGQPCMTHVYGAALRSSADNERQLLGERDEALETHISSIRSALRVVRERQQAFLTFVGNSTNPEVDNEAYCNYMQETKVEDAITNAENLLRTLQANLDATRALLEELDNHAQARRQLPEESQSSLRSQNQSLPLNATANTIQLTQASTFQNSRPSTPIRNGNLNTTPDPNTPTDVQIRQPLTEAEQSFTECLHEITDRNPDINVPLLHEVLEEMDVVDTTHQPVEAEMPEYYETARVYRDWKNFALLGRQESAAPPTNTTSQEPKFASVAEADRPLLLLLQKLTVAMNPSYIFDSAHLGAHDYVLIDSFLRDNLYKNIRSHFTREVHLPSWSERELQLYPNVAIFDIVHNLKGIRNQCDHLVDYISQLSELTSAPQGAALFEHIQQLRSLIDNITYRRAAIFNNFFPFFFRKNKVNPHLPDALAQYNLHYADFEQTFAMATATIAEAQEVIHALSDRHLKDLSADEDTTYQSIQEPTRKTQKRRRSESSENDRPHHAT